MVCFSLPISLCLLQDSSSLSSFSQITTCHHSKVSQLITSVWILQDIERLGTSPGLSQSGTDTGRGGEIHHCLRTATELQKHWQKSVSNTMEKLDEFTEVKTSSVLQADHKGGPCSNFTLPDSTWEDHTTDQPALTVSTSMVIPTVFQRNIFVIKKSKMNYCKNHGWPPGPNSYFTPFHLLQLYQL